MFLINLRRAALVGFLVALSAVIVFFGFSRSDSNKSVSAQENSAADAGERLKTENPDAFRAGAVSQTLSRLFAGKEVDFDEAKLLPNRVDGAKTIQVSFNPTAKNLNGGDFSESKPDANSLKRGAIKSSNQTLARQRAFELSPTQILIVSVDAEKRVLWWDLQPDPRVFHRETADDNGVLSGATVYRQNAEMLVNFPASDEIRNLYFYSPNWDGKNYSLELIGTLDLNNSGQNE